MAKPRALILTAALALTGSLALASTATAAGPVRCSTKVGTTTQRRPGRSSPPLSRAGAIDHRRRHAQRPGQWLHSSAERRSRAPAGPPSRAQVLYKANRLTRFDSLRDCNPETPARLADAADLRRARLSRGELNDCLPSRFVPRSRRGTRRAPPWGRRRRSE
jgi:hypothetical protein